VTQSPPAVILAAGRGERLSVGASSPPKPLTPLLGLTLLERVILLCKVAGIDEFYVVLGHCQEEIQPHLATWGPKYRILIHAVDNPIWLEGNGTSVLACAPHLSSSFLILMSDHLVDPTAISHLIKEGAEEEACYLLVDHRVDRVFDPQDATRVHVDEGKITAIGKRLEPYNGIDTGVFLCQPFLFDALKEARAEGDGSLTGAIRRVADQGKMRAVDYGDRPTAISLVSFLIVFLGALLFVPKGYAASLFAGILIQLGSVLDGCDGEVARLTFRSSRFGAWLDTLLDRYGDAAVAVGITWGFWRAHPSPWVWLGGVVALTGFLLTSYSKKEYALRYGKSFPNGIWARLIKRDLRLFGLFLGAVLGYPYFALLVLGLFSHVGIGLLFWKVSRGVQN